MSSKTAHSSDDASDISSLIAECERLRLQEQPVEALRLLDMALGTERSPTDHITLLLAQAAALNELNRVEEAIEVYRTARNADTGSREAQFGLGFTLYLAERWQDALAELDALVAVAPAHPNAAWMRAGLLRRLYGDGDARVLDAYALVLVVDPSNAYAQVERADALRAIGRYEEARDVYARFQTPDSCDDEALRVEAAFKRGCVAMVLNETAEARNAFQTVLDAAPDYPDAKDMLALVNMEG